MHIQDILKQYIEIKNSDETFSRPEAQVPDHNDVQENAAFRVGKPTRPRTPRSENNSYT